MGADARKQNIIAGVAVTAVVLAIVGYVGFGSGEPVQTPTTSVQDPPMLASDTPLDEDVPEVRRDTSQASPPAPRGRIEADQAAAANDEDEDEQAPSAKKKDRKRRKGSRKRNQSSESEEEVESKQNAPKHVPPERPF